MKMCYIARSIASRSLFISLSPRSVHHHFQWLSSQSPPPASTELPISRQASRWVTGRLDDGVRVWGGEGVGAEC
eukprot:scaffold881_cov123-Isochrysis_galbana.AAC.12